MSHLLISFRKAVLDDLELLTKLSLETFVESHGHSASKEDIDVYTRYAFSSNKIKTEIEDSNNFFYFIYNDNNLVGYSKIIPNFPYNNTMSSNSCKLERIYISEKYLGMKFGQALFNFNLSLSKEMNQKIIWLYSWIENHRGISFYKRNGFQIIDQRDFKISNNHSNPNYIMSRNI